MSNRLRRSLRPLSRWIYAALMGALPLTAAAGQTVSIFQMGGNISVESAPADAKLRTLGGDIDLGKVGGDASLHTNGGNIHIGAAAGDVTAITLAGDVDVVLVGSEHEGPRTIDLSSNAGAITLHLPRNFGAKVDITLTYTNNQPEDFHIKEDLGLTHTPAPSAWDDRHGTPRKSLKASGKIGDGSNRIVISTINGDVTIVRD